MMLVPLLNPKFANTLAARPCELRVRGTSGVMVHLSRAMVQYMPLRRACRRSGKWASRGERGRHGQEDRCRRAFPGPRLRRLLGADRRRFAGATARGIFPMPDQLRRDPV